MPSIEDSCPHAPAVRASRCPGCCATHLLPPCAEAWLQAKAARRSLRAGTVAFLDLSPGEQRRAA